MSVFRLVVRSPGLAGRVPLIVRCSTTGATSTDNEQTYTKPVLKPLPHNADRMAPEGFFGGDISRMMGEKLGRSGAPCLGAGLFLFAVSKEFYQLNAESTVAFAMLLGYGTLAYNAGPKISAALKEKRDMFVNHLYYKKRNVLNTLKDGVKAMEKVEEQASVRHNVFDVLRTNAAMHREALYRARLAQVHDEVLKRLDHQAELEASRRRNIQKHMVTWVERQVSAGFSPEMEKRIIDRCISDLKSVSTA